MIDTTPAVERIRSFILDKFPLARKKGLKDGDPLLDSGILDSLGVLDVVGFLEKEFAVHVSDDELIPEHFQSVEALAAFVKSKASNGSGTRA
jgi:acyl carrier protein